MQEGTINKRKRQVKADFEFIVPSCSFANNKYTTCIVCEHHMVKIVEYISGSMRQLPVYDLERLDQSFRLYLRKSNAGAVENRKHGIDALLRMWREEISIDSSQKGDVHSFWRKTVCRGAGLSSADGSNQGQFI